MDPLSHAALGAVCGAAAAASSPQRLRIAAATGALAALLPDADVLIRSEEDPLLVLELHRQFSHSLIFVPVGALLVAGLVQLAGRGRWPFGLLFLASALGIASASLLDAATSYGTQLLWPFSDRRIAWSAISVVDPVFTLPILVLAILAMRTRRWRYAGAALAFAGLYLALGAVQQHRVARVQTELAASRGHAAATESVVKPTLANLVLWRSVYLAEGSYHVDAIRLPPFVPVARAAISEGGSLPSLENDPAFVPPQQGTRLASDLERFRRVSEGWLVRHPSQPGVVADLRYAMLPDSLDPLWGIRYDADRPEEAVRFETFRDASPETRARFRRLLFGGAGADSPQP